MFQKEKAQLDGNSIRDSVPLQSHLLPFWLRGTARVWLVEVGTQHGTWTSDAATWVVQTLSFLFISPYITCFPQGVHSLVWVRKHAAHVRERDVKACHMFWSSLTVSHRNWLPINITRLFNHYHTAHQTRCVHLKSASYGVTWSGVLRSFKCRVHSCRDLELWLHSLSPHTRSVRKIPKYIA